MDFIDDLNEQQREAVLHLDGPSMVIAGAGSGKTRVLTYRLAFILSQGLAYPQELLALTFTNKAAREMKARIMRLVGDEARGLIMGTFHSIFSRILRVEAERIGYTSAYTIYDSDDSKRMIKTLLKEMNLDDKTYKPRIVQNSISYAKNRLISPQEMYDTALDEMTQKIADVYKRYEIRNLQSNAMDFDDLLVKPIKLFQEHAEILHKYQHRYKFIMVDEYQDTNHAQYLLTKMMAAVHENICVVGDDAQSIYAFRGANIDNILNFEKDYPSMKLFKLEQNYRSTQTIVQAANSVIARNKDQIQKKVFTQNESGELIYLVEAVSEQDEAKRVSSMIREQKQLHSFFNRDFAVLYRTNAQSRAIEDELRRSGVRYKVFGGLSFYQRKEIKDVIAYMRLTANPHDEQALVRIINYPKRGIGQSTVNKLVAFANDQGVSIWDALLEVEKTGLSTRAINQVKSFVDLIQDLAGIARRYNAGEATKEIAKQSKILQELRSDNNIENIGRLDNVDELINAAQAFSDDPDQDNVSLESFLADISLFTDQDDDPDDDDFVSLMTIHSAKGLEFKSIYLVGMEENIIPNAMAMETRKELEEERRLFYVAVTRAEKFLTLSYAKSRYRFGTLQFNEPSRFLDEIDAQYLRRPQQAARRTVKSPIPGRRPANRRNLRPLSQARQGPDPGFKAADPKDIVPGIRVKHQKFGKGKVLSVEGEGMGKKAIIAFSDKGQRVLLLKYAKLQIMG